MNPPDESTLTFNVVWTGDVFTYLQPFVTSQIAWSRARFRFVANGCPPEQLERMEVFRARHPGRVVEVLDVSPEIMVAHGVALDRVRSQRDDGDHFCFIDPDIKANGPWLGEFCGLLSDHAAVTSGREVWSQTNVLPEGHVGVPGEVFYDRSGFIFGSPHLALYRRAELEETIARWSVGLGSAGPELRPDATEALASLGHRFLVYDTAKIVNCLLQHDGHRLVHRDLPQLVHIGGLAHYLSPPAYRTTEAGETEPDWTVHDSMAARHAVTRYCARVLRALADGDAAPAPPDGLDDDLADRLAVVHHEIVDLMARHHSPRHPRRLKGRWFTVRRAAG